MHRGTFAERRRMKPLATRIARLDDYRLRFNIPIGPGERGVANVEPAAGSRVWGVLYLVAPEEFDRLDHTEAVHLGVYCRTPVEVVADGEERLAAFTYCSMRIAEGRKPSLRYMQLLLEGAREHGLPPDYVRLLESFELAVDERVPPPDRSPPER
jgi:gamma-glutamylcyclotransferase